MVDLVTIHHEGAGDPSDNPRGADGGYTYWIGTSRFERLRSVASSFATLHFNHVSLDICLSGNRMDHVVTDNDIALIHGAFMDARAHGEIVDVPRVQAHRDNNGKYMFNGELFSTVCPGDLAMARWPEIVAACRPAPPAPVPVPVKEEPMWVAGPHKPVAGMPPGPAAGWFPTDTDHVKLVSGQSIKGDRPGPDGTRIWDIPLPPGAHGDGIYPYGVTSSKPLGTGIIARDTNNGAHIGPWS